MLLIFLISNALAIHILPLTRMQLSATGKKIKRTQSIGKLPQLGTSFCSRFQFICNTLHAISFKNKNILRGTRNLSLFTYIKCIIFLFLP